MASRDIPPLSSIQPLRWEDNRLSVIDQRQLPWQYKELSLNTVEQVAQAIEQMVVRGAPLIGITAGYGVALAALADANGLNLAGAIQRLAATRPTARDLFAVLERFEQQIAGGGATFEELLATARRIHHEDLNASAAIASHAGEVFGKQGWAMTICNTGALATGGGGTALGLIIEGFRRGLIDGVYVCETRPLLQGARLTCWELTRLGVPFTLLVDSAAASLIAGGKVNAVVTGADRIARNGDTANKVGTRMLAQLAQVHQVPFYIAVPLSTFDHGTATSAGIPIEQRTKAEVLETAWAQPLPPDYQVYNPSFDVTEANLITGIVTERGVLDPQRLEEYLWS